MSNLLSNKVAIITGSGRGIGRGIARLMASEGASVVVNDLGSSVDGSGDSIAPADEVVEEIRSLGGQAVANYDSVTTMDGGENIIRSALDNFGKLDIVVTPAGILRDRMIFNMTEEEWDDVIAVHLKGTFSVVKPASVLFRQQKSGVVITFSSVSGLFGTSGQSNYGAAKDGIAGVTRAVARDLGRYISSPQQSLELNREPDDVAPMVVWLASDEAKDVNGYVFHCQGGSISLMNNPTEERSMRKNGRWTVEEIDAVFPGTLGMDMGNPAPPQEPRK